MEIIALVIAWVAANATLATILAFLTALFTGQWLGMVLGLAVGWWLMPQPKWLNSLFKRKKVNVAGVINPGRKTIIDAHGREIDADSGLKRVDSMTGKNRW